MKGNLIVIAFFVVFIIAAQLVRLVTWSYQPGQEWSWDMAFAPDNLRFFWTTAIYGAIAFAVFEGGKALFHWIRTGRDKSDM